MTSKQNLEESAVKILNAL